MPLRSSTLPDREVLICKRLRQLRLDLKWGMPDFAEAVGIPRDRLASYEYARAPVRYTLARAVCERFNVNASWLATGVGSRFPYTHLPELAKLQLGEKTLFSEVYDSLLADVHLDLYPDPDAKSSSSGCRVPPTAEGRVAACRFIGDHVWDWFARTPDDKVNDLLDQLVAEGEQIVRSFGSGASEQMMGMMEAARIRSLEVLSSNRIFLEAVSNAKIHLDALDAVVLNRGMSKQKGSIWEKVRARLVAVTQTPTSKAQLAKRLGVTAGAVSQWRTGASRPDAENTLRLLDWIISAESGDHSDSKDTCPKPPTRSRE